MKKKIVKVIIMSLVLIISLQIMISAENQSAKKSMTYKQDTMDMGEGRVDQIMHQLKRVWEDPEWILELDMDSELKEFIYELQNEFGPLIYPILIIFILILLIIGLLSIVFTSLLGLLFVFIVIKIIQTIVRGGTEEANPTAEADAIGVNVYYLYLVSLILPIICLAGISIAYIYRKKASDWMKTHYRFQIRTFWIGALYSVISSVFTTMFIGFLGYIFIVVWFIIRSVQGIRAFKENKAIAKPETWLWN